MNTAGSFLLLFILAVLIFGVPLIMLAIRLIETITEWRESLRLAEDESTVDEKAVVEKKAAEDPRKWTPAHRLR